MVHKYVLTEIVADSNSRFSFGHNFDKCLKA